jgi:hypothetical protein
MAAVGGFRRGIVVVGAVLAGACGRDAIEVPSSPLLPLVTHVAVAAGPWNVLSAVVTARVVGADSVGVRFRIIDSTGGDSTVPAVIPLGDSATVPVLGLLPTTSYTFTVVVYGPDDATVDIFLPFTTGPLPGDLPVYVADGPAPSPGASRTGWGWISRRSPRGSTRRARPHRTRRTATRGSRSTRSAT